MSPGVKVTLVVTLAVIVAAVLVERLLPTGPEVSSTTPLLPEEQAIMAQMRRVLTRDDILPIYRPQFVPAARAALAPDELVLGVAIGAAAKAYPITVLNGREMVNDELDGIPILVTW